MYVPCLTSLQQYSTASLWWRVACESVTWPQVTSTTSKYWGFSRTLPLMTLQPTFRQLGVDQGWYKRWYIWMQRSQLYWLELKDWILEVSIVYVYPHWIIVLCAAYAHAVVVILFMVHSITSISSLKTRVAPNQTTCSSPQLLVRVVVHQGHVMKVY